MSRQKLKGLWIPAEILFVRQRKNNIINDFIFK